jgi:pantetheine-phosphate adenylyltransferase
MSIAVYAGSFDPITAGHLSIVRQAARLFSHVRVLVAVNPKKQGLFTSEERQALIEQVLAHMPNVTVGATEGYVVHYARDIAATFLVRGIRGASDAGFETDLAHQNRELAPEITTILLPAEAELAQVSSSGLKERARRGEPLEPFCPAAVAEALRARLAVQS